MAPRRRPRGCAACRSVEALARVAARRAHRGKTHRWAGFESRDAERTVDAAGARTFDGLGQADARRLVHLPGGEAGCLEPRRATARASSSRTGTHRRRHWPRRQQRASSTRRDATCGENATAFRNECLTRPSVGPSRRSGDALAAAPDRAHDGAVSVTRTRTRSALRPCSMTPRSSRPVACAGARVTVAIACGSVTVGTS